MSGCLVQLILAVVGLVLLAIFRVLAFVMMLMVTAIASLFVGFDTATERIAASWIDQFSGQGVAVGYNPVTRDGIKAGAGFLLVVGWVLDIGAVYLIASQFIH